MAFPLNIIYRYMSSEGGVVLISSFNNEAQKKVF